MTEVSTYKLRNLLHDVEYVERCFADATQHAEQARKPENNIDGKPARGTPAEYHLRTAAAIQEAACERQEIVNQHRGAAKVRTYCAVIGERFTAALVRRLFAVAALRHDRTLDELLETDLGEAVAMLPAPEQLRLPNGSRCG
jgi:hypothetical protein